MHHVRGVLVSVLMLFNMIFWGSCILLLGLVKRLLPSGALQRRLTLFLARLGEGWVAGNDRVFDLLLPTVWDVEGIDTPDPSGHYLIISNHLSWVDIFVLFRVFHRKAAFIHFFLKQELIWFPIAGQACWALGFPFMKRYSPEYLARHPEKRGQDLETTRRACQRFRTVPTAVLNFLEGTRFTEKKRQEQDSPYRHLLRPRVGGIGFVLASLGDQLDSMFDVTIAYPGQRFSMWDFVGGLLPRIVVRARRLDIPAEFMEPAMTEPGPERDRFKSWIEQIWSEKDDLLQTLAGDRASRRIG